MLPHSSLCTGVVRHRRYEPLGHAFKYRLYMTWLDCDDIDKLDALPLWSAKRFSLVQFRRSDYLAPHDLSLKEAVSDRLRKEGLRESPDRVAVLTHLRNWGLTFNPVTFYVAYRADGGVLAIISEINNTPWDERHSYVHIIPQGQEHLGNWQFEFDKRFHVSPFMPMDLHYQWRFRFQGDRVWIHMRLWNGEALQFDASLGLTRQALDRRSAIRVPLLYPFMTARVVVGIYWQALRLWMKRTPFYDHPETRGGTHVS